MSTGGIFQLITNDGKQDRMLNATALLNKRLLDIETARANDPTIQDPTPTLTDIERTHILFMNAHFKPFCAQGYEYNKVSLNASAALGQTDVTFSIPQFGDFFNDMVLHVTLGAVTATNAAFWTAPAANPAEGAELLAYCNYPGQRLCLNTKFNVNGNPLDQYTSDIMNFHQKFFVLPNKVVGWNRCVGQEVPLEGFEWVNNQGGGAYGRGAGIRQVASFLNGAQTPAPSQPALDLWIPLLFWFNMDPRLSIPSVSIPYGQRFIQFDFATPAQMLQHLHAYDPTQDSPATNPVPDPGISVCELYINNIFVNPEIHDIFIKRIGFSMIRVHRYQTFSTGSQLSFLMNQMKWPIETMYVGLIPQANVSTSSNTMLYSWNQYCEVSQDVVETLSIQNGYTWLAALGLIAAPTPANLDTNWVAYTGAASPGFAAAYPGPPAQLTLAQINGVLITHGYPPLVPNPPVAQTTLMSGAAIVAATPPPQAPAYYYQTTPIFQTIDIEAHGITLYPYINQAFYNYYIPYTYGGNNVNTPYDVGACMITFNLYPGSYQPSGHVNISRAREFYFNYTVNPAYPLSSSPVNLVIIGIAINFLLISDGSAILRYST